MEQSLQAALGQSAVAGEHAQANSQSAHLHNDVLLQQLPSANGLRAWACICCATTDLMPESCRHVSAGKAFCSAAGTVSSKKVRLQGLIDVRCRRRVEVAQRAERICSDGSAGSAHIRAAGGALWGQPGPQAGSRAGKGHRSRWCAPLKPELTRATLNLTSCFAPGKMSTCSLKLCLKDICVPNVSLQRVREKLLGWSTYCPLRCASLLLLWRARLTDVYVIPGVAEVEASTAGVVHSLEAKQAQDTGAIQQAASAVAQDASLVQGDLTRPPTSPFPDKA